MRLSNSQVEHGLGVVHDRRVSAFGVTTRGLQLEQQHCQRELGLLVVAARDAELLVEVDLHGVALGSDDGSRMANH